MPIASPHDVLTFWFAPGQSDRWYAKDEAFDAEIRQRFLPTYEAACSGHLDAWREGPHSLLALIIVLDQFPRNTVPRVGTRLCLRCAGGAIHQGRRRARV